MVSEDLKVQSVLQDTHILPEFLFISGYMHVFYLHNRRMTSEEVFHLCVLLLI